MKTHNPMSHSQHRVAAIALSIVFLLLLAGFSGTARSAPFQQATPTGIFAEAYSEANVRSGPGIEYDQIGTIFSGTRYQVIGQHEFFPWLLLEYPLVPGDRAWVFADVVTLNAPLTNVPIITETTVIDTPSPSPSPTASALLSGTNSGAQFAATTQAPSTVTGVYLQADEQVNVRFGPGVEYPRIERLEPGRQYAVISRHSLYPWLLIELPEAPDGVGWVYQDVVDITGNVTSLPAITVEQVAWPTLTPTPPFVVTAVPPWQGTNIPDTTTGSVDMQQLGDDILAYLLATGFVPEDDSFGSVFILDLQSGESITMGTGIEYSGMSLIKIPILVTYYRTVNQPASRQEAEYIVNTMICSGNHTANALLGIIGNGDMLAGAQIVTDTMQALGLSNTFVIAPFDISQGAEPTPQPYPVFAPDIDADASRTNPDPYNQSNPADLGWLLNAVYQCGMNESGPLLDTFPGEFTPTECRQIIQTMSNNQINVLTEAGVPTGTRVAHKHGWINDTHGDAAIVFTPGGDFAFTIALYEPEWLPYERSWPVIAEIARMIYNAYNPDQPLEAIHPETVDESCDLAGNPLLTELTQSLVPPIE